MSAQVVNVGVMLACSGNAGGHLDAFVHRLADDVAKPLRDATGLEWRFHIGEALPIEADEEHRAADFVGEASLRLTEGSFDLMLVIADVPLLSQASRIVAGLGSPLTRIAVLSTTRLRRTGRGPDLPLDSDPVRWNAATLALHLIGRVLGTSPKPGSPIPLFRVDPGRDRPEWLDETAHIRDLAGRFTEREYAVPSAFASVWAHVRSIAAEPGLFIRALVRNRAPFLALKLPGLAAAAVAPTFLLVFTAEFWDAGLGMSNGTAAIYATISIIAATLYLTFGQRLFLPRKDNRVIPQHLALANVVILATLLLAVVGLFAMVAAISLAIELWIFPPDLIATWPTLQDPRVTLVDKLRLASFISTIGVTTGALAGGLQRRQVMRHLALFQTAV